MAQKLKKVKELEGEVGSYQIFNIETYEDLDGTPVEVKVLDIVSNENQLLLDKQYFEDRLAEIDSILADIDKIKVDKLNS